MTGIELAQHMKENNLVLAMDLKTGDIGFVKVETDIKAPEPTDEPQKQIYTNMHLKESEIVKQWRKSNANAVNS